MSKRRVPRSSVGNQVAEELSDSESNNFSDSENEYGSGKRIRFDNRPTTRGMHSRLLPKEDDEHTYSCTPIFKNLNEKDKYCSSYSSDSDNEKSSSSRRISERSTSIESTKRCQSKRKPKCGTKNAVMARQNRQKKKEYVEGLEGDVKHLNQYNKDLKLKINKQQSEITTLKNQIQYLRSALLNNKEIGMLLRRVCGDKMKLNVTSSLLQSPQVPEIKSPVVNYGEGTNVAISDSISSVGNSSPEFNVWDNVNSSKIESDLFSSDHGYQSTSPAVANCYEDAGKLEWPLIDDNETMNIENLLKHTDEHSAFEFTDFKPVQSFGVCLHVANKQVSLEFCDSCNRSALKEV